MNRDTCYDHTLDVEPDAAAASVRLLCRFLEKTNLPLLPLVSSSPARNASRWWAFNWGRLATDL